MTTTDDTTRFIHDFFGLAEHEDKAVWLNNIEMPSDDPDIQGFAQEAVFNWVLATEATIVWENSYDNGNYTTHELIILSEGAKKFLDAEFPSGYSFWPNSHKALRFLEGKGHSFCILRTDINNEDPYAGTEGLSEWENN